VILLVVTQPVTWLGAVMRSRWLRWLGSIAYGVYLVHQLAAELIVQALWHSRTLHLRSAANIGAFAAALAVTLIVCHLSYRYFEEPLIRFAHRSQ
jgi:peptidoglycan/LPS O-acetylase OafA/YrhL